MTETNPATERQRFAKAYWDGRAARDAHYSIWGDPSVIDPEQLDEDAFARSGELSLRQLLPFVNPKSACLEIGCGIGRILRPLAGQCARVIGVDISPEMIAKARDYMAGVSNAELIVGDGASLPGVADQSLDFVYSLLVLIHVDKRSAYRYLREIERVLRPGGLALLQFQNMLSPKGLELFQGVVDSDYPFEFYTPEELRWLLKSVGLEVFSENLNAEFVEVSAVRGSAEAYIAGWRRDLAVDGVHLTGLFDPKGGRLDRDGVLAAELKNKGDTWRTVQLTASLQRRYRGALHELCWAHGVLSLPPGGEARIEIQYDGKLGVIGIEGPREMQPMPSRRCDPFPTQGALEAHFAIIPAGFVWSEATAKPFPTFNGVLPVDEGR